MSQGSSYCHKCGAALPYGATYCPRCGTPVAVAPAGGMPGQAPSPPTRPYRYEKYEKHEKREKQEKGRRGDLAGAITGGLVLILLGILFYFSTMGTYPVNYGNFWQYFLIGLGAILILQGIIRYAERRVPNAGSFIGGAVLILIGAAFVSSNNFDLWPLILVVLGIAAIASAFTARRRAPVP